jgi:hypothetical protein
VAAGVLQIYAPGVLWRRQIVERLGAATLATDATTGFLMVPTCPGTPTGTPELGDGAMVVDSTNNRLLFYSGGAWRAVGLP